MDRLIAMQAFQRVAELGSFSLAAQQLDLSKSAVSKMVRALEDHLGARLLNRTTRRLSLTEAGANYADHVARLLAELADIEAATANLQAAPKGQLKINAPMSFGQLHVAPLLPGFLAEHPEISVDLTLNDRVVDLIDEGFDLAIRIGELSDSSLIAKKLDEIEIVVVASPSYLSRRGVPETPQDLSSHDCLIYAYGQYRESWRLKVAQSGPAAGWETVRVDGRLRANNGDVLSEAAINGLGLAMLPTFIAAAPLADGRLVRVLPEWTGGDTGIFALYPHNRHPLAKLRVFIDYVQRHLRLHPR